MDIVSYILAKNASKGYTDEVAAQLTEAFSGGLKWKGEVNYYTDLPQNPKIGDAYTVKYTGTEGTEPDGTEYAWGNHDGVNKWIAIGPDTGKIMDHIADGTIHVTEQEKEYWNGKLDEVLDTSVKLSTELKTYYNIGKIQNASGTNPVVIGHAGDTLRQVLNNLTQMDEEQPTITQAPAITAMSFSSGASDEQGTEITEVNYSLNTREGTYTYGPSPSGVSWSAFGFSGGCVTTEKTTKTGSLTLTEPYIVGESSAVSIACSGTHSAGAIAKTNLGNDSDPVVKIAAGTKTRNGSFSKAAVTYVYSKVVPSTVPPTSGCTKQSSVASFAVNGAEFEYAIGDTIWLLTATENAQIQTYVLGEWWDVTQYYAGTVQLTQANGAVRTYYAYRTDVFTGEGSAIYRIV